MTKPWLAVVTFAVGLIVGGAVAARAVQTAGDGAEGPGVTGIGGVFFRAEDPAGLREWYARHLGIGGERQGVNFFWREREDPGRLGFTVWSVFARDTAYFGPSGQDLMINYRVRDLDALLETLAMEGIEPIRETEEYWYGRFSWILDGEGNRVELWEPVPLSPEEFEQRLEEESNP